MEEHQVIASRENSKIKLAKSVREGRESDLIFIEGLRLAEEALRSPVRCRFAFVSEEFAKTPRIAGLLNQLAEAKTAVHFVTAKVSDWLSDTAAGQGIVLLADRLSAASLEDLNPQGNSGVPTVVFVQKMNNPSNLGAIVRTAEASGAAALIISSASADPFSPKALRASMGSAFRLPICPDTDLAEVLHWASRKNLITTAADVSARTAHTRTDWRKPRLLVIGSEAHGLDGEIISKMEELTLIEMANGVESLNVAVACGIILFEARRQNASVEK